MAALAKRPTTLHISGGLFDVGRDQEYELGRENHDWFDPPLAVEGGKLRRA